MIDRDIFYNKYRQNFGSLNQSQVQGLNFLLERLDESPIINDGRHYAYILGTVYHECNATWQPIKEMGSLRYLMSKHYYPWFGRGYVQLSWEGNYIAFNPVVKEFCDYDYDIVKKPDDALEPDAAWIILEEGMTKENLNLSKQPNFVPGQTLEKYFNDTTTDWVGARHIINGTDKAHLVATYAMKFYDCIEFVDEPKPQAVNPVTPSPMVAATELEAHKAEQEFAMNYTEPENDGA